jgi:hypothetical protein
MKFSKKIVSWIIAMNILFTAAVLYIFLQTYTEPSMLIGAWFSFTTVELWSLAGIKKREIRKEETENTILSEIINPEGDTRGE